MGCPSCWNGQRAPEGGPMCWFPLNLLGDCDAESRPFFSSIFPYNRKQKLREAAEIAQRVWCTHCLISFSHSIPEHCREPRIGAGWISGHSFRCTIHGMTESCSDNTLSLVVSEGCWPLTTHQPKQPCCPVPMFKCCLWPCSASCLKDQYECNIIIPVPKPLGPSWLAKTQAISFYCPMQNKPCTAKLTLSAALDWSPILERCLPLHLSVSICFASLLLSPSTLSRPHCITKNGMNCTSRVSFPSTVPLIVPMCQREEKVKRSKVRSRGYYHPPVPAGAQVLHYVVWVCQVVATFPLLS